ncbi:hypothetical protein ABIB38_004842 [Massilia sp. UYP11]|uniref:hypothetical protein n=1 Tax=Massilia sp. UYP11 TaxID=1756385 RepID=UPI003D194BE9
MTTNIQDTVQPFRSEVNGESRNNRLKSIAQKLDKLYNVSSSSFKGTSDEFVSLMRNCVDENLWEICYYLKTGTGYTMSAKIFKELSTYAQAQGNLAFYYALCSLAITGGLYPFSDVVKSDRAQEQHLKEVTSTLYGEDIDSRGWEKNSMFGI